MYTETISLVKPINRWHWTLHLIMLENFFDALCTAWMVPKHKEVVEQNPLWLPLLEASPVAFTIVKILWVGGFCWVLHYTRDNRFCKFVSYVLVAIYSAICVWWVYGIVLFGL